MSNEVDIDPFADDFDADLAPTPVSSASLPTINPKDVNVLTPEEKKKVIETWNGGETSLKKIIESVAGEGVDGRSKKGIAIKQYLTSLNLKARAAHEYKRKSEDFDLTEANKEYIRQHAMNNKPLELARELFNQPQMTNLSTEAKAVLEFYNTIDPMLRFVKDVSDAEIKKYNPPKTHQQAIARINNYVYLGLEPDKLSQKDRLNLDALIKYTHVHRFVYTMNEFTSARDRELFESSFIRFCHDKPDITEEEIDLYINLCTDIVNNTRQQRGLEVMIESRDQIIEETGKVPIAVVDSITATMKAIDDNLKRQKTVTDTLQGKRSERVNKRLKENASVVQLVDLWKNEEKRKQLIEVANLRKQELKDEVDRLSNMDDIRFQLWGIGKEEIVNY